jgi:hypothetical protein
VFRLDGHEKGGVQSLAVTADGKSIVSGGGDKTARVWDASNGHERYRLEGFPSAVVSVAVSPDGRLGVACAHAGAKSQLRFWDMESKQELAKIEGAGYGLDLLTFSADGKFLLACEENDPGIVKVWEVSVEAAKP